MTETYILTGIGYMTKPPFLVNFMSQRDIDVSKIDLREAWALHRQIVGKSKKPYTLTQSKKEDIKFNFGGNKK